MKRGDTKLRGELEMLSVAAYRWAGANAMRGVILHRPSEPWRRLGSWRALVLQRRSALKGGGGDVAGGCNAKRH